MPLTDLPVEELRERRSDAIEPADFDAFWRRTLREADDQPLDVRTTLVPDLPWRTVEVRDVEFSGARGDRVRAWLTTPAGADHALPAVVQYVGYGGGRGLPGEQLDWASAGYAHLLVDTRGQGGTWGSGGSTPDPVGAGPATPGFMTRGIEDPEAHYYRRVYTDAVRAVQAVRAVDLIADRPIAVTGASQGGGIALAVAGLVPDLAAAMIDVPFLCDIRRGADTSSTDPYGELVRYLRVYPDRVDAVFATLAYFDGVHHAARAQSPALFSVGLMDPVCPPSTVFAAHNAYAGPHLMQIYEFAEHQGGGFPHRLQQMSWLTTALNH